MGVGAKWPDGENGKLGPWWRKLWNIWGLFDDAMGKLEILTMGKNRGLWWPDGEIGALDHKLFSNSLIWLHSFKLMGPKF